MIFMHSAPTAAAKVSEPGLERRQAEAELQHQRQQEGHGADADAEEEAADDAGEEGRHAEQVEVEDRRRAMRRAWRT